MNVDKTVMIGRCLILCLFSVLLLWPVYNVADDLILRIEDKNTEAYQEAVQIFLPEKYRELKIVDMVTFRFGKLITSDEYVHAIKQESVTNFIVIKRLIDDCNCDTDLFELIYLSIPTNPTSKSFYLVDNIVVPTKSLKWGYYDSDSYTLSTDKIVFNMSYRQGLLYYFLFALILIASIFGFILIVLGINLYLKKFSKLLIDRIKGVHTFS